MDGKGLVVSFGLCAFVLVCLTSSATGYRTCGEARYCCPGRNNTCFAFGPRTDGNEKETRCFCDQACVKTNDCCRDYRYTCESKDCMVGTWSKWGPCKALGECGIGTRERSRKIIRNAKNGGQKCPVRLEKRACVQTNCDSQRVDIQWRELSETGKILPAKFGKFRHSKEYSPFLDIRKNLQTTSNRVARRQVYKSIYKIESSRFSCQTKEAGKKWANAFQPGNTVCVQCDPEAMSEELGTRCIGHGVYDEVTRWKAVHVPYCNGKWKMLEKHQPGACTQDDGTDFIFI